jgi:hypothetical protein
MRVSTLLLLVLIGFNVANAQLKKGVLLGRVQHSSLAVDGIHIINKTSNKNTITNQAGEFTLGIQLNDTIVFSAVQYELHTIIVNQDLLQTRFVTVQLEERVNQLDEVVVQNHYLSGDLSLDMNNAEAEKPINFYDLGIPGYKGKPLTQPERRLFEATTGGGIIPLNPILNAISGRTKMLKAHIAQERLDMFTMQLKVKYNQTLKDVYGLKAIDSYEFFLYCADDEDFENRCKNKDDLQQLDFFISKVKSYLELKKESAE